jgi:hypothetical protein
MGFQSLNSESYSMTLNSVMFPLNKLESCECLQQQLEILSVSFDFSSKLLGSCSTTISQFPYRHKKAAPS